MTLTYISCSSDFYAFYINVPLSLGCIIRKVSAEDIAIRGNGTGQEYMCPIRHFVYTFFNPVFQVSTAKNEINLFNNHILIVAPVTFAPAGAMTPSAEFLFNNRALLIWSCVFISGAAYFVDAMSSFGAVPLDLKEAKVDYIVSSANKCLEGVPGFSYVIARLDKLLKCKGI